MQSFQRRHNGEFQLGDGPDSILVNIWVVLKIS